MKSRKTGKLNKLDSMTIASLVKIGTPGLISDGGNLNLQINGPRRASWIFRYRAKRMGLGPYPLIGLAEAREKAHGLRKLLADGIDPLEHRETARLRAERDKAEALTFQECTELWLESQAKICSPITVSQARGRVRAYAYPKLANLPIRDIDTATIFPVLETVWNTFPVAASYLRIHLEQIFNLAKFRGLRDYHAVNPATWKGHLEYSGLHPLRKIHTVQHRKMLDYPLLPEFIVALEKWRARPETDKYDGTRCLCQYFQILTTSRPGEAARTRWAEIVGYGRDGFYSFTELYDQGGEKAVREIDKWNWHIPADKMKGRRAHRIPLPDQALNLIIEQRERATVPAFLSTPLAKRVRAAMEDFERVPADQRPPRTRREYPASWWRAKDRNPHFTLDHVAATVGCHWGTAQRIYHAVKCPPSVPLGQYVFAHRPKRGNENHIKPHMIKSHVLIPMGYGHIDQHGFRASFSTWINEEHMYEYPRELREFQLAHKVDDATAEAYQRGTGVELRRRMMQHWADFVDGTETPKVVPLRRTQIK